MWFLNQRGFIIKLLDRIAWNVAKVSRLTFWYLTTRVNVRVLTALYVFTATVVSIAIMGVAAYFTSWVFVFPSIGPSAFLIFYAPSSAMSAPRNTILGHLAGVFLGYASYKVALLLGVAKGSTLMFATSGIAMGFLGMLMVLTGILHPPAASSCLIASLGFVKGMYQILGMMGAVVVMCVQGYVMNNLVGIKYPLWSPMEDMPLPKIKTVLGDVSELQAKDHVESIAAKLAMRQKIDE